MKLGRCLRNIYLAELSLTPPLFISLPQLFFKLTEGRVNCYARDEDVNFRFNVHRRERAIAMVVDVVYGRGQDFVLKRF
jgi:hypothetical protein